MANVLYFAYFFFVYLSSRVYSHPQYTPNRNTLYSCHIVANIVPENVSLNNKLIGHTQLLLPPTLNVAFRSFEPRIAEPFPNEKLLRKKKIAATEQTIFH